MRPLFSSESDLIYAMLAHASDPMHSLGAEQRKAIAARVPELKVYKHCGLCSAAVGKHASGDWKAWFC